MNWQDAIRVPTPWPRSFRASILPPPRLVSPFETCIPYRRRDTRVISLRPSTPSTRLYNTWMGCTEAAELPQSISKMATLGWMNPHLWYIALPRKTIRHHNRRSQPERDFAEGQVLGLGTLVPELADAFHSGAVHPQVGVTHAGCRTHLNYPFRGFR